MLAAFLPAYGASAEDGIIVVDAESATINNQLVVETDSTVLGGKYVRLLGERLQSKNDIPETVDLSFKINVPQKQVYVISAHTKCKTSGENSFWFRIDGGSWKQVDPEYEDMWVLTLMEMYVPLDKGEHTIDFHHRESGARIDFVCFVPAEQNVPVGVTINSDNSLEFEYTKEGNYLDIVEDIEAGTPEGFATTRTWNVSSIAEFESIMANVAPGDEVVLDDGEYTGEVLEIKDIAATQNSPVRIRAKNPGKAIFTGNTGITVTNCKYLEVSGLYFKDVIYDYNATEPQVATNKFVVSSSSHCRITNNYFERCGCIGSGGGGNVVRLQGASNNNRVDHNTFDDCYSMQVAIGAATSGSDSKNTQNMIDHNHFVNIQAVSDLHGSQYTNGMESVQLGSAANLARLNTIVEYNLFENVIGDKAEIISSKSNNNLFRYNSFLDCHSGLTLRHADGNIVENNYFRNSTHGIRVFGKNHKISGNYMENISRNAINIGRGNLAGGYITPDNNIIKENTIILSGSMAVSIDPRTELTADETVGDNYIVHDNIVVTNIDSAFSALPEQTIDYKGNKAVILKGADKTVKADGIEYFGSVDEIDIPPAPKMLTTDEVGTLWKKGVNTNSELTAQLDRLDTFVAYGIGNENACVNGEIVKAPFAAYSEDGYFYVPLKFTAEKLGCTVTENGNSCTIVNGNRTVVFTEGSDVIVIDGKNYTLGGIVRKIGDEFVTDGSVLKHCIQFTLHNENGLMIVFPTDVVLSYTLGRRYTDRLFVGNVMMALGNFETAPTYFDAENEKYAYDIPFMNEQNDGYSVGVSKNYDSGDGVLYVAEYDEEKRLIQVKSTMLDLSASEKVFVKMTPSDDAVKTKAFVLGGFMPMSGWIEKMAQ